MFLILISSLFWTHSFLWACPGVFTETGEASCRSGWWWTGESVGRRNNPRCSLTRQLDPRSAGDRTHDTGNVWHTHRWEMNTDQDPDHTDHLWEQIPLLMINRSVVSKMHWNVDQCFVLRCFVLSTSLNRDFNPTESFCVLELLIKSNCDEFLTVYGLDNWSSVKLNRELKPYSWWDVHKSFQRFSDVSHQINNFPAC